MKDLMLALLLPLLWGTAFTLSKPASEHFPTLFMQGGVYLFCSAGYALFTGTARKTPLGIAALLTLLAGAGQAFLLFLGLSGLDASVAVLLLQVQVPITVLASALINRERISPVRMLGIAIAFGGVAAVAGLPSKPVPLVPLLEVLAGALMWGIGQALIKRFGKDSAPNMFRIVSMLSWPAMLAASLLIEHGQLESVRTATPGIWASLAGLTIGGMALGNGLWYLLVMRRRMDEVAPFLLLMPVVGVVASALVLGETISLSHYLGGALILLGLAIVTGIPGRYEQPSTAGP